MRVLLSPKWLDSNKTKLIRSWENSFLEVRLLLRKI
jgi:hypothetical protein